MTAGMANKHTKPWDLWNCKGVVATTVCLKNEGRGRFFQLVCDELKLNVGRSQFELFKQFQDKHEYGVAYKAREDVKIKRARQSTAYATYIQRVDNRCDNVYETDVNIKSKSKPKPKSKSRSKKRRTSDNHNRKASETEDNDFVPTEYDISALETANKRRRLNPPTST